MTGCGSGGQRSVRRPRSHASCPRHHTTRPFFGALVANAAILGEIVRRARRSFAMHNVYHLLVRVLPGGVEGAVVELGSRVGWSAILLRRILDFIDPPRELHVYDAFELGFEPPSDADEGLARGVLFEQPAGVFHAGAEVLLGNFAMCRLAPPIVHAGGFRETLPDELPDRIAFADLDSDLYESILQGLEGVYPLLVPGAVVLIDDCGGLVPEWPNRFPGVLRAWTDYLVSRPEALRPLYGGGADPQAFFTRGTLDH